jgi:hypothetical protein
MFTRRQILTERFVGRYDTYHYTESLCDNACIRVWPSLVCLAGDQFLVKSLRQEDSGTAHFRLRTDCDVPYSALIMLIPNLGSPST